MNILGISNDETASACLVIDGNIIAAASEERFSRKKMDNSWPQMSIEYCLSEANLKLNEIDFFAYGWSHGFDPEIHMDIYINRILHEERYGNEECLQLIKERFYSEVKSDKIKREEFNSFIKENSLFTKTITFDHHSCHAYSAFLCSPFQEGLVVTSDGRGDFSSLTISKFKGNKMVELYRSTSFDSFGFFYGRITSLLGFTPHKHEGKVTGLAAHGNPDNAIGLMKKMIDVVDGVTLAKGGKYYKASYKDFSSDLLKEFNEYTKEDIAAAAQKHLENCVTKLINHYLKENDIKYIALAGGVFANVKLNQSILELEGIENIFVQPHMGDGGLALGSAVATYTKFSNKRPKFENMFLGPDIGNDSIDKFLNDNNLQVIKSNNLIDTVLEALNENLVVGLARGRMEFGPRALCHRSIIFHCKDQSVNMWLNKRMRRTEFMPFAPATALEFAELCYKNWSKEQISSYFMTLTYNCTDKMKLECPAVVHLDGTARPQIVSSESDPFMHNLLLQAHEKYGYISLINTSFNAHEEPIVCNQFDALNGLVDGMIDLLLLDDTIITHKNRDL